MRQMVRRRLLAAEAAAAVVSMLVFSTDLASSSGSLSASMAPEAFFPKSSSYGWKWHVRHSCGDPETAHGLHFKLAINQSMLPEKSFWLREADLEEELLMNLDSIEGFDCCFLTKKGIKEDRIDPYNNQTEYSKALSKGSKNGGGSATVDENPYFGYEHAFVCSWHFPTFAAVLWQRNGNQITPSHLYQVYSKTSPLVHDVRVDSILDIAGGYEESPTDIAADIYANIGSRLKVLGAVGDISITVDRPRNWNTTTIGLYIAEDHNVSKSLIKIKNSSKPPIQWIFLKPLTKELWLATVCLVFFTAFVFWMIERSINPLFQGSSLAQFSTALYFAFSTLTFSNGQILRSPLSKFVLVVWCFAVLVLVQSYLATLSSMLAADASTTNGSSAADPVALTLQSFSGLFIVTGCILAFMLIISFTRWVYANYARVRGSESQNADTGSVRPEEFSTPQNDTANGSVVPEKPVQEVRDKNSQGAHVSSAISGDEEAGGTMQDSMCDASEPAPDVYVEIEMSSTINGVDGAM